MKTTCLITGASGGLGTEFARLFARDGYDLVLTTRNKEKMEKLKKELEEEYKVRIFVVAADLTSGDEVERLYHFLQDEGLPVGVLVNNAGFGDMGAFLDSDWERQQSLINVNMNALVRLTYLIGRDMRENGFGRIINVASIAAFSAGPYMSLYYASKSFVLSFSQALSQELRGSGVTVTALCPGPTSTGFEKNAHMGNSVMFSRFKPTRADKVAEAGYRAAMKGKSARYAGFIAHAYNIITRFLPRTTAGRIAAGMDRQK